MPLEERAKEYANRLLAKSRKQIDSNFKTRTEQVIKQSTPPGSVLPGLMLQGFIDALIEQIRQLGTAKMESLLTAYGDAGVPLDEGALAQIRSEVMAFTHSEQHRAIGSISKMLPAAYGQFTTQNGEYAAKQIYDGVTSVMEDLGFEIDIKRDKHALVEASQKRAYGAATGKRWDVFISHASEDKDEFVRPLAKALEQSGLEVWFDEITFKVGDRLRESIDYGLSRSRFGVVVLSRHFFLKDWTKEELEGLTTKEIGGVKVILPVWYNVTRDDVAKHSPTLAGRLAARSQDGLEKVVRQLREAMGKESPKSLESVKKIGLTLDQENITPPPSIPPVVEAGYHEHPTPQEMNDQIHKVSMLSQGKIAENYRNLKVKWKGVVCSVREISNGVIDFTMKCDGHIVCMKVQIDDYPILRTVRGEGDELVTVKGTIDYVQSNGPVHLKDVKLTFSLP